MDVAIGTGVGGFNWTGSTVVDNPTMQDQQIDATDFTTVGVDGLVAYGYGTLSVTGVVTVNGNALQLTHTYELQQTASYVRITTEIENITDPSVEVGNVNLWVGTRDDYVGTTDRPVKTRGVLTGEGFQPIGDPADSSDALQITSGGEGVFFYSTTPGVGTSIANYTGSFSSAYNTDPSESLVRLPVDDTTTHDGTYAIHLPIGDLAVGASEQLVWFYAAGEIDALDDVARDVADAAAPDRPQATAGDGAVTLAWEVPDISGGTLDSYELRWSTTDAGATWTTPTETASTATTDTVTGLVNGQEYVFQVRARVDNGTIIDAGDWSPSSLPVTPGVPFRVGQPTIEGDAVVGATLTVLDDAADWTSNDGSAMTASYQWYAGDELIEGATGTTFTVTSGQDGQVGQVIRAEVTRTNDSGSTSAETEPTAEVPGFAQLTTLEVSDGTLSPAFAPETAAYELAVPSSQTSLVLTATAASEPATVTVDTASVASGEPLTVSVPVGTTVFVLDVVRPGGHEARYQVTVTRPAPPPAPVEEEPSEPEPVRDEAGALPAPGETEVEIDGERETVTVEPTPTGGVSISGTGFLLEVEPDAPTDGNDPAPAPDQPDPSTPPADDGEAEGDPVGAGADLVFTRGTPAQVRAQGFRANSTVSVWLFSEPTLLGEFQTDAAGALTAATEAIGDDIDACLHTLHAEGELADGRQVRLSLGVWVDANPYPFGDVRDASVHRRAIACLVDKGIVRGTAEDAYTPAGDTTRGQAASMFARWFDLEATGPATHPDAVGTTHEAAIAALVEAGIAQGFDADTFGPNRAVTRGQFASMLAALLELPAVETSAFSDAGRTHGGAIGALAGTGSVTGFADGTFRPSDPITRAQAASIIVREIINRS